MNDFLDDAAKSLGLPKKVASSSISELKKEGFIFTKATRSRDIGSRRYPVRLVYRSPLPELQERALTFGPFPMDRRRYERLLREGLSDDAYSLLLAIHRLSYELSGSPDISGSEVTIEEDELGVMAGLLQYWHLGTPVVRKRFVWFEPKDEARKLVEDYTDQQFDENDFSWWNCILPIEGGLSDRHISDPKNAQVEVPSVSLHEWPRYLPTVSNHFLIELYGKYCRTDASEATFTLEEAVSVFDRVIESWANKNRSINTFEADRNLLIKELLDNNGLMFPLLGSEAISLLVGIGLVIEHAESGERLFNMRRDPPSPRDVLAFPRGWGKRFDRFVREGSVLFTYLTTAEILRGQAGIRHP